MRVFAPVIAILLVVPSGCQRQSALKTESCPELSALQSHNPKADAMTAFGKGDKRLLEMGGYQPSVPGAEDRNGRIKAPAASTFRMLEGTRDGDSAACDAFGGHARAYAKAYNREMLALMANRAG